MSNCTRDCELCQMIQAYADFMYQTGLVDEKQRDYVANVTRKAVDLINRKKYAEAADVCFTVIFSVETL